MFLSLHLKQTALSYEFHSKSGGEVIQDVLFARKSCMKSSEMLILTRETCIMIPRMNSILIVGDVVFEKSTKGIRAPVQDVSGH